MHAPLAVAAFLLGASTALPAGTDDCSQTSRTTLQWQVTNFDFRSSQVFTSPQQQNTTGTASFTLEHKALDFKAVCKAQSSQPQPFFDGSVPYTCKVPPGSKASFTFSRPDGQLSLNETWFCTDQNSGFLARGGVKLDLKCKENEWKNPDWKEGQIYSSHNVTCDRITAPADITELGSSLA